MTEPVTDLSQRQARRVLLLIAGIPVGMMLVRIDPDSPLALTAEWPVVNQSSSQHIGYAVQWFAMAGVLFLIGVWRLTNVVELLGRRDRA